MSDIVERLRASPYGDTGLAVQRILAERQDAATAIERLEADNARLRAIHAQLVELQRDHQAALCQIEALEADNARLRAACLSPEELRAISRKLTTYAGIYTGDKEASRMAKQCSDAAGAAEV